MVNDTEFKDDLRAQFKLPFSLAEYKARIAKVQSEMEKSGVDLLLIHTPENMLYLSGYETAGYFAYQCLILPVKGEPAILTRWNERGNAEFLSCINQRFSYVEPEDKIEKTVAIVREFSGIKQAGIEKNSWFLTVKKYEQLVASLKPIKIVDCSKLVDRIRLIKSKDEIRYIREAAGIADLAMIAGVKSIREGATENEIAAAVLDAATRAGSEYTGMPQLIKSGERCSIGHAAWNRRVVGKGDVVYMELSGCVKRYSAQVMRTVQLRPEDPQVRRAAEVVIQSLNETIQSMRPGITAGELYTIAYSTIEKGGFAAVPRRMGYSVGIGFPPRWGEWQTLDFRANDKTEMVSGMVFHVIPAIALNPKASIGFTETVLITDQGHEVLTKYPRTFQIL